VRKKLPAISGLAASGVRRWLPLLGLLVAVAAAPLLAQRADLSLGDLPTGVTPRLIAEGEALFLNQGLCFICHGTDATGARGVGADLTDAEWWHSDGSYEAIVAQILTGVSTEEARNELGAMMPPRGGSAITEEQVHAVAAYVWSLRLKGDSARRLPVALFRPQEAPPRTAKVPSGVIQQGHRAGASRCRFNALSGPSLPWPHLQLPVQPPVSKSILPV